MITEQPETDELAGRVALVTGAARGQGRAIARRLSAAGARVIAGDVLIDELASLDDELCSDVVIGRLDVREMASWEQLVGRGVDAFGQLDIVVNNAGVLRRQSVEDESPEGFEDTWRVNCLGPFLGIRASVPLLRRSDAASIVNTSSTAGQTAWSKHAAYVSSKWAIRGLSRAAAVELAADGIRVNTVLPGPIATPMLFDDDDLAGRDRLPSTPLGRIGEPEDVAEAVLFLASRRSAFLTGSEIVVDGGQTSGVVFTGSART